MTTSEMIMKVKKAWSQMRSMEGQARAKAKVESERGSAEIQLIMDDIRAEGINPMSPLGLICITHIWQERQRQIHRDIHKDAVDPLNGGFPNGW
jgi:hypothetical protein